MNFIVTGSGRCGTTWLSRLLTVAGIPCGHESVFHPDTEAVISDIGGPDWRGFRADSSWQAVPFLERFDYPVVLLVRHPLDVVNSLVELGFFGDVPEQRTNPVHRTLRGFAPHVYEQETEQDAVLAMWLALNRAALRRAELLFPIERFGLAEFGRLVRWAGVSNPAAAERAFGVVKPVTNDFPNLREATGRRCDFGWDEFKDRDLVAAALDLAGLFGYEGTR